MKKDFSDFLSKKNCFKLILGANNQDCIKISEIIKIYYEAGCRFFDISASKDVYNIIPDEIKKNSFICVSVGTSDDIHFSKCKINTSLCKKCNKCKNVCIQNAIDDKFSITEYKCIGCQKCKQNCSYNAIETYQKQALWDFDLFNCIDCIEFHISSKNKEEIFLKWKMLVENFDGYISISTSRKYFSDTELTFILSKMLEIKNNKIIIQADGNSMTGGDDDCLSSLQALSCCDFINKNFKNIPVFLSGGVNDKTYNLAKMFNLDVTGISVGSFARKIIEEKPTIKEKIFVARKLIETVK
jgi:Fe-S-cluster-containing hydrogenase component 2